MSNDVIIGRESVPGYANFLRIHFRDHLPLTIFLSDWLDWELKLDAPVASRVIEWCKARDKVTTALVQAEKYLRFKPRTEYEVRQFLLKKEFDEETINGVLQVLKDTTLIDDKRYVRMVVRSQSTSWSRKALTFKLRSRGIDKGTIQEVLADEMSEDDERANAIRMAEKYIRQKGTSDWRATRLKCGAFLQRKGFHHALIMQVLHQLGPGTVDEF